MERAGAREEAGGASEAGQVWPGEISTCICVSVSRVAWEANEVPSLSFYFGSFLIFCVWRVNRCFFFCLETNPTTHQNKKQKQRLRNTSIREK